MGRRLQKNMEYLNTYEVENEKLYNLLKEKKVIVDKGREISKKLEPLQKKIKPLQEELIKLERKLKNKQEKMFEVMQDDVDKLKENFDEYEDLTFFEVGKKKNIVEFHTVDLIENYKNKIKEEREKENAQSSK